ncbi:aspartate aminotransferase family protein [Microbacterium sp. SORGH_AS_0888]|uniref:aspartate aminotransferase family protein n=1 Tax=Microbacterium sp. SORGH_AS_0888 TaxID=3041791 RepID=UPI00278545A3|nr:aspartate aminotransferase family protein [Microbacterium sp. SORGH_AS_0888]MDQ1128348.1 4-aminobutyrate aminotransferase-like enzyme [Microbacterium sp. SORGH_AS_0888]
MTAVRSTILDANAYEADPDETTEAGSLIARRRRLLGPAYRLFYEDPVRPVRGSGAHLYDVEGVEYLDVYNNVASVGHAHPRVAEAIAQQAARLSTHTRYLSRPIVDYAEDLLGTMPAAIARLMLTCSGSEANDLAVRMARAATGGTGVIITEEAYHGNTDLVSGLSPALGSGSQIGPAVWTVPAPDTYRADEDPGATFAAAVRVALSEMSAADIRPAALLVDTIFSSDGVYSDPPGFLAPAVDAVRAAGGVFIADEVQPGFGRTGSAFWGFARHGLTPDLVTMGKPMGNGYPVAAVAGTAEVLDVFAREVPYFNTFGGNDVAIAAAQAVLDVIRDEGLQQHAADVGAYFRSQLRTLATRHEAIGDVRGDGAFTGLELVADRARKRPDGPLATRTVNGLRARRVLTSVCGPQGNVLKLRPPLPFTRADADRFVTELDAVLARVS